METYYVNNNAQSTGEHEVHKTGCAYLPQIHSKTILGSFSNCRDAVQAARRHHNNVDGCATCSPACHTR